MSNEERVKWVNNQKEMCRRRELLPQYQSINEVIQEELSAKDIRRMKNRPDVPTLHAIRGQQANQQLITTNPRALILEKKDELIVTTLESMLHPIEPKDGQWK